MNVLNYLNKAIDNFFDFIDPIPKQYSMNKNVAAYIIQNAYRRYLIRKYFNHMKNCIKTTEIVVIEKKGWFS